jgi:hypothetical protein
VQIEGELAFGEKPGITQGSNRSTLGQVRKWFSPNHLYGGQVVEFQQWIRE